MTYASIAEAWGSTSGAHMLNTNIPDPRMTNSIHPVHQQRINNIEGFSNTGTAGTMKNRYQMNNHSQTIQQPAQMIQQQTNFQPNLNMPGTPPGFPPRSSGEQAPNHPPFGFNQPQQQGVPYMCNYGDISCAQAVQNNNQFNNMQKMVAAGIQPFTPWSPNPQNYAFAGQYPWYPWARQGFLNYGNDISSMWYNQPWMFYPDIARQVQNYQVNHPGDYRTPIERPYQPPSYGELYERGLTYPTHRRRTRRREAFGDLGLGDSDSNLVRNCLVIFIFFLLAVSTLLVTFVIAMKARD